MELLFKIPVRHILLPCLSVVLVLFTSIPNVEAAPTKFPEVPVILIVTGKISEPNKDNATLFEIETHKGLGVKTI